MAITKVQIEARVLEEARRVLHSPSNEEVVHAALLDEVARRRQLWAIDALAALPVQDDQRIDRVVNVAVYLEPDLLELTRARRRATGMSYDELTGEAFAVVSDDQLVRVFQPAPGVTSTTGMPTRQRRPRGTARNSNPVASGHQPARVDRSEAAERRCTLPQRACRRRLAPAPHRVVDARQFARRLGGDR